MTYLDARGNGRHLLLDNLSTDLLRLGSSKLLSVLSDVRVKDPTMPYNPLPTPSQRYDADCVLLLWPLLHGRLDLRSNVID